MTSKYSSETLNTSYSREFFLFIIFKKLIKKFH